VSDAGGGIPPVQPYGQPEGKLPDPEESFSARLALAQRAGGLVAPLLTVVIAFVMGGLVVLITTGKNPLKTYKAIFEGAGLNWFFQIPWDFDSVAAFNLQQTLIQTTTFILVGLAVAFAFRCGLFNIGGQGQYLAGAILAVWIGSSFEDLNPYLHVGLAIVIGTLAGALIAGIAGFLKATVGAHEVISTIMLNWIVLWVGVYLFGLGGPLQNDTQTSVPVSNDVAEGAKLHVFWGDPLLQGLHIGIFFALGALIVYSILLNRTTLGYGVKAVGFNPGRHATAGSASRGTTSWRWRSRARSPGSRARSTFSAGSSGSRRATCRPPWSGSPASPWRCSAATPRSAPGSQRCCSARCSPGRRPATSTPTSSSPSSPRTSPS
jgi:simple sugar transport system permease protein